MLSICRTILRSISWAAVAAALAGIVQNELTGTRSLIASWLESGGAPTPEAGTILDHLGRLPAWPVLLSAALLLVVLTRAGSDASYRETSPAAPGTRPRPVAAGPEPQPGREIRTALRSYGGAFAGVAAFSGISNVLMLTGSFFMLVPGIISR